MSDRLSKTVLNTDLNQSSFPVIYKQSTDELIDNTESKSQSPVVSVTKMHAFFEKTLDNIKLKKTLEIDIEIEYYDFSNVISYILKNDYLGIYESAYSYEEAINAFFSFFIEDSENYFKMKDNQLDESGKTLKKKYQEYI